MLRGVWPGYVPPFKSLASLPKWGSNSALLTGWLWLDTCAGGAWAMWEQRGRWGRQHGPLESHQSWSHLPRWYQSSTIYCFGQRFYVMRPTWCTERKMQRASAHLLCRRGVSPVSLWLPHHFSSSQKIRWEELGANMELSSIQVWVIQCNSVIQKTYNITVMALNPDQHQKGWP